MIINKFSFFRQMPRFIPKKEGALLMHPTDCSTCKSWSESDFSDEEIVDEMMAKFVRMSVDKYQGMTVRETNIRLFQRCQEETRKIKDKVERKRQLVENRQSFDAAMALIEKEEAKQNDVDKEAEVVVEEEEDWE
jgi:hypothetical protein